MADSTPAPRFQYEYRPGAVREPSGKVRDMYRTYNSSTERGTCKSLLPGIFFQTRRIRVLFSVFSKGRIHGMNGFPAHHSGDVLMKDTFTCNEGVYLAESRER